MISHAMRKSTESRAITCVAGTGITVGCTDGDAGACSPRVGFCSGDPMIRACAEPLLSDPNIAMASVWSACSEDEGKSPHVVKVVLDQQGNALYFSRSEIPYPRSERRVPLRKHVGIYAYRREVVQAFSRWPMGALEATESLEQLRFLENGIAIRMVEGSGSPIAVDTPEQAVEVRAWMLAAGMSAKSW